MRAAPAQAGRDGSRHRLTILYEVRAFVRLLSFLRPYRSGVLWSFVLAAVANTLIPSGTPAFHGLWRLGIVGLTATLYLIGSNVSRATLKQVGARPLIQGVLLWLVVAVASIAAIRAGWVAL